MPRNRERETANLVACLGGEMVGALFTAAPPVGVACNKRLPFDNKPATAGGWPEEGVWSIYVCQFGL